MLHHPRFARLLYADGSDWPDWKPQKVVLSAQWKMRGYDVEILAKAVEPGLVQLEKTGLAQIEEYHVSRPARE